MSDTAIHARGIPNAGETTSAIVARWLGHPAAAGLGRRLWGGVPSAVEARLPRLLGGSTLRDFLRPDDVALELARMPQTGGRWACLLVPRTAAARVVDHVLGGDGQVGQAMALREAEYGVLAYALARSCAELGLPFEVCSAGEARGAALAERFEGGVARPFLLQTALGPLDLRLLISAEEARATSERFTLQLTLRDRFEEDPRSLQAGEVLLSDAWPLSVTSQGLSGRVLVREATGQELLRARIDAGTLLVTGPAEAEARETSRSELLEVVLGELALDLVSLASLCSGVPCPISDVPHDPVQLLASGRPLAEGSLVVHRGALGIRIHSMR